MCVWKGGGGGGYNAQGREPLEDMHGAHEVACESQSVHNISSENHRENSFVSFVLPQSCVRLAKEVQFCPIK